MSPLVLVFLFCNITYALSAENVIKTNRDVGIQPEVKKVDEAPHIIIKDKNFAEIRVEPTPVQVSKGSPIVEKSNATNMITTNTTKAPVVPMRKNPPTEMESGAVMRGVLVFVGLSILFIIYVAFKTTCRKKSQPPAMVRKYGIRTRRSDIEMTPLPLEDDEDDDTVFEVGNVQR